MKVRATIYAALGTLLSGSALFVYVALADQSAIAGRDAKYNQLAAARDKLKGGSLVELVNMLGTPTRVEVQSEKDHRGRDHVTVVFTYEYEFKGVVWRQPYYAWLKAAVSGGQAQLVEVSSWQTIR